MAYRHRGVITGTSVGTRLEMRELLHMHSDKPFAMEMREISLAGIETALEDLAAGQVDGRIVIRHELTP
ncbi:hypothetical protein [Candidatus Phyllobacterium onerii]|uniref:hypothetical protein n=1 Tax=Candidatus Phyllobacterium onerii TaxID=3020828 RepID=UPI00232EA3DC|nr:hypothetical protein [Phyllobacterium sp. IY22]